MKKLVLVGTLLLAGCGEDGPISYLKIAGGGIQFNYRVSEATMVVVAQQTYPLPQGSHIEALFDIPGTNARETVKSEIFEGKLTYALQSQPMFHIQKDGKYNVTIRLIDKTGKELDRKDRIFTSDQDQDTLPTKPLVEGPALAPHLENN